MTDQQRKTVENLVLCYQGIQELVQNFNKAMSELTDEQKILYADSVKEVLKDAIYNQ